MVNEDRELRRLADKISRKLQAQKPDGVCYVLIMADVAETEAGKGRVCTRTDLTGQSILDLLKSAASQVAKALSAHLS